MMKVCSNPECSHRESDPEAVFCGACGSKLKAALDDGEKRAPGSKVEGDARGGLWRKFISKKNLFRLVAVSIAFVIVLLGVNWLFLAPHRALKSWEQYYENGDYDSAEHVLDKAIAGNPRNIIDLYVARAYTYIELER